MAPDAGAVLTQRYDDLLSSFDDILSDDREIPSEVAVAIDGLLLRIKLWGDDIGLEEGIFELVESQNQPVAMATSLLIDDVRNELSEFEKSLLSKTGADQEQDSQRSKQSLERVKQSVEELIQYVEPFQSLHPEQNRSGPIQLALEQATKSLVAPRDSLARSQPNVGRKIISEAMLRPTSLRPSSENLSNYISAEWNALLGKVSKAERKMFLKYKADDLPAYVAEVERICKDKSRARKVARLIKPLFKTTNMYAPIAQTTIQVNPTPSAVILGGITCIMSISSRFLDHQEEIAEVLSQMGEKLEVLLQYESDIYTTNNEVMKSLMEVFGDVLQFCSKVWHMFQHDDGEPRNIFKILRTSLTKSFEEQFGDIIHKFDKDLEAFKDKALLCDRKEVNAFRSQEAKFMKHQILETSQNYRGIVEIGQGPIATTEEGQLEEAHDWEQPQLAEAQKKKESGDKNGEEKRRKVLAWLPSIAFHKDQEDKSLKRLQGTGQWLLKDGDFQHWKTKPDSGLLWIYGKRGCGKSYLASRVIQDLSEALEDSNNGKHDREAATAMAYIYCNSLDSTKIDPSNLLGSILKQLCHLLPKPEIETSLEKLYDRHSEVRTLEVKEIKDTIMAILGRFSRTFLVVDGLDECHKLDIDQFEDLCEFVRSLTLPRSDASVVKAVAFSRPEYATIKAAFAECPSISIHARADNNDIKQFITTKLSGRGLHVKENPKLLAEIEGTLLSGADGMFLWVDIVVNSLRGRRTAKAITATVRDLPRDLDDVYEESMRRILEKKEEVRTLALRILLWTTNVKRPLSQKELLEALAVETGMRDLDEGDKLLNDDDFASDCADLIILDNNNCYQLLHSSLKDYLRAPPTAKFNVPMEYRAIQTNAEKILGETCLTYLNFDKFSSGPAKSVEELVHLLDENPFLDYASIHWGQHVAAANEIELRELVKDFLSSDGLRDLSMQLNMLRRGKAACPYKGKSTPLHMLSIFNLVEVAKSMPEMRLLKTQPDGFLYLPLDYALAYQSRQMCNWLLERSDDDLIPEIPPECHNPPIHAAASNDWGEAVESLIAWKYDPEFKHGERQQTPLHVAACQGSESALDALLRAHVNINVGEVDGTTPLIDAAENNHPELAKRLLEEGAQVNVHGWNGTTALHHAAKNGDVSLVKLLLEKGADKDSTCAEGWGFRTPLHLAAEENSHEVLKLLIAEHADIEKVGAENYNAFLFCCNAGFSKCLTILLEAGAKIDGCSDIKRTAFHMAALNGHLDILKILFEKRLGQSQDLINADDSEGNTALHYAVMNGRTAEAKLLLENGTLPNKVNKWGHSPLHNAIVEGETEIGGLLLDLYKADARLKGPTVSPPLHYAASYGRADFIPLLLEANADPEDVNYDDETAVHCAARTNNLAFLEKLREAVPTLDLAPKSKMGQTPLHIAAKGGFLEFVNFLLRQEASSIEITDNDGSLPLHYATWGGDFEVVKQLLTENNIDSPGYMRGTALFRAAYRGYKKVAELLLDLGANPDLVDNFNQSPLLVSIRNKHPEIAVLLLDRNADPKIPDRYGVTPLHQAAVTGSPIMVKRLLDAGCDGLHPSAWGVTPFVFAIMSGNVKVVDVFLGKGINGCDILEKDGTACSHRIAESGSIEILEKLKPFLTPSIINHTDCIGRNAMNCAAREGHVGMIDPLRSFGIPADGLELSSTSPLYDAVCAGHFDFVGRLLELGVDIHKRVGSSEASPLHIATGIRMQLIADKLVRAGANPTERDAFGLSCLDYAICDPKVWESMGKWKATYQPTNLADRKPILRQTIQRTIQAILALPEEQAPRWEFERLDHLFVLARALLQMGTPLEDDAARTCFIELASPVEFSNFSQLWMCNVCMDTQMDGKRYECKQCFAHPLCSRCYPDYLKGGGTPKSAPESLLVLQKLENEMKPIREVGRVFAHSGGSFFISACQLLPLIVYWVDKKMEEYDEWEKTYNASGRFNNYKRPGQIFLKLVKRARKVREAEGKRGGEGEDQENEDEKKQGSEKTKNSDDGKQKDADQEDSGNNNNDDFATIAEELSNLYRKYRPDTEVPDFICSDHEYLEVPDKSNIEEAEKKHHDADGKVTNEWLARLFEKYQDNKIGGHADQEAENEMKDDFAQPEGPRSESEILSGLAEESNIKGTVRQDLDTGERETPPLGSPAAEPIETNSAMTHREEGHTVKRSNSGLTDVSSDPSTKGRTSTDADPLAGKTAGPEAKTASVPTYVDDLTIKLTEKWQMLEMIKQELKTDIISRLESIMALKKRREDATIALQDDAAEDAMRQGEEGKSLDKGLLNDSPKESEKRGNAEDGEESPPLETDEKETVTKSVNREETTELDKIVKAQRHEVFMITASDTAWQLAQIILTGHVQHSFLEELLEDKEGGDDGGDEEDKKEEGRLVKGAEDEMRQNEREDESEGKIVKGHDILSERNNDANEKVNNQVGDDDNGEANDKDDKDFSKERERRGN